MALNPKPIRLLASRKQDPPRSKPREPRSEEAEEKDQFTHLLPEAGGPGLLALERDGLPSRHREHHHCTERRNRDRDRDRGRGERVWQRRGEQIGHMKGWRLFSAPADSEPRIIWAFVARVDSRGGRSESAHVANQNMKPSICFYLSLPLNGCKYRFYPCKV